ncbi:MAG: menaquinol oxidoreductase [Candidatus Abyssobacteria bacterium SURF_17]|jgi:molybdopterin-containing oxidoreductase family membrane subunit|uniref:Menaquinol oxidoreductase n=1 Tax=Candidatus Abyssobacteria bacterium SURF_17 TaxID=2093361 RepID=A0A419EU46_9BACT|nr:MAG: menaquinol oxidoreductase [Candidatus Abyssubacteria bacterium SURF_17]
MLEKALTGSKKYWSWITLLLILIGIGFGCYLYQLSRGLTITGMGRDISWGLYIAQFTFLVGVAASAVMVVLPYYLHNYKAFGKITVLGEFLAVSAVTMCLLFVLADLGNIKRMFFLLLYPTPNSIMFWDMIVLNIYLLLNIVIAWNTLAAERKGVPPPAWLKPLIYLSIPWAVSIHTVTAFLYAGLPGRHLWLTAILAVRFLGSAFAAGPALLVILCLIVRRISKFDPGKEAIQNLGRIVTYALLISIFFVALEFFTAYYSKVPGHIHGLQYLFFGLEGHAKLVPWMRVATVLAIIAAILLVNPNTRKNETILGFACAATFISLWIEKGIGLVLAGFVPNPLEKIVEYTPTAPELLITLGIWATGFLILTVLYKIAVSVKEEVAA